MTTYVWLTIAGLLAGYINAMAGAGSLLTLPALVFTGLDANTANATNRIAVLFQTMATSYTFRQSGISLKTRDLWVCMPAFLGTVLGAYAATLVSNAHMQLAIALVMGAMVPALWLPAFKKESVYRFGGLPFSWGALFVFTGIGFYIGFIQAAAGILILLYLGIMHGVSLIYANALKVVITMLLTVVSLSIFSINHMHIDITRGLLLSASTSIGGVIGAKMAIRRGEKLIRVILAIVIIASAAKLTLDTFYQFQTARRHDVNNDAQ